MSKIVKKIGVIALLVTVLGGSLTFIMTWRSIGFTENFVSAWLSSFALSILCIAPIGGIIAFLVNKMVNAVLPNFSKFRQDIVFGLIMAVIMESIMAVVTTANLHGFLAMEAFINHWGATFLAALPMGIVISILMSLIIKPRLATFWAKA